MPDLFCEVSPGLVTHPSCIVVPHIKSTKLPKLIIYQNLASKPTPSLALLCSPIITPSTLQEVSVLRAERIYKIHDIGIVVVGVQLRLAVGLSVRRDGRDGVVLPDLVLDAELARDQDGADVRTQDGPEDRHRRADRGHVDLEHHEQDALGPVPGGIVRRVPASLVVDGVGNAPGGQGNNAVVYRTWSGSFRDGKQGGGEWRRKRQGGDYEGEEHRRLTLLPSTGVPISRDEPGG